jgi:hypothetical protein
MFLYNDLQRKWHLNSPNLEASSISNGIEMAYSSTICVLKLAAYYCFSTLKAIEPKEAYRLGRNYRLLFLLGVTLSLLRFYIILWKRLRFPIEVGSYCVPEIGDVSTAVR